MQDRVQMIVDAGLGVLREHGYVGFTQPRVAARAGLRQSHITYYFPTRVDLVEAVGRAAVDRQLAAVDAMFAMPLTPDDLAGNIAELVTRHENTRVLLALAQAGDQEPRLRHLFSELADGVVERVAAYFSRLHGAPPDPDRARFLHRLAVGLAVVDLATSGPDGKQVAAGVFQTALRLMAAPNLALHDRNADGTAPNDGESP